MVAKTWQKYPVLCEPYEKNGKLYVQVRTKTNPCKEVRYYSEYEYAKLYGEPVNCGFSWQARCPITIYYGADETDPFCRLVPNMRYSTFFGWYSVKGDVYEGVLPSDMKRFQLEWDEIHDESGKQLSNEEIARIVNEKGKKK